MINSIVNGIVAGSIGTIIPSASGGGGPASLRHRFIMDTMASAGTLVDHNGYSFPEANTRAAFSAAGGNHATLQSLDTTPGATNDTVVFPFPATYAADTGITLDGSLGMVIALRANAAFDSGDDLVSHTDQLGAGVKGAGSNVMLISQFQSKRYAYVGAATDWQTWIVYMETGPDDDLVLDFYHNGSKQTLTIQDTTGAGATTNQRILGDHQQTGSFYIGDFSIFDVNAESCVADMLAEEAVIRSKWV